MYLQLGTFMNTLKRMTDVLHCWVEEMMQPWAPLLTVSDEITPFGEHMNSISVVLKQKYKKYLQAVVKKLLSNVSVQFLPVFQVISIYFYSFMFVFLFGIKPRKILEICSLNDLQHINDE
jgi:hypothetical protein